MFLKKERPLDRDTEMRREPQTSHDTQISPGPGERAQEMSPTQPDTGQAESPRLCPSITLDLGDSQTQATHLGSERHAKAPQGEDGETSRTPQTAAPS